MRIRAPGPVVTSLVLAVVVGGAISATAHAAYFPSPFRAGAPVDANRLGDAIVAWNGPTGGRAVLGDRQGNFGPVVQLSVARDTWGSPQAAIDERGDAIVADRTGRVCVRPAGGTFGAPEVLPEIRSLYGPGAILAANAAGDALAAYPGARGVAVSRRPAGGSWSAPAALTAVGGASERAITIADRGMGAVAFVQIDRDPRLGGRASLLVATFGPDLAPSIEQVNAAGFDADMADALDTDGARWTRTAPATRPWPSTARRTCSTPGSRSSPSGRPPDRSRRSAA